MALVDGSPKIADSKNTVIISNRIWVASPVFPRTLAPIYMFLPWQPDNEICILSGLFGVDVNAALDNLTSHIEGLVHFHVEIYVLIFGIWGAHSSTFKYL